MKDRSGIFNNDLSAPQILCIWRISVETNLKIALTVDDITVLESYGWFRVFDGDSCDAKVISMQIAESPSLPTRLLSTHNNLIIMTYGIQMKAYYNTGRNITFST
ncbi:hypothetical protein EG68_02218 [Paragonimus skrjabini miyazakii]|uniref:CUB domain-containing protein n=1 Tax=Paragonimus skrjabini miyazakii TaxID=59628 RepID=A0A8S9Z125_9TREM|nr:hypothetical protein EG68_02218 [Paragonimus skrjabini miyazakii]